MASQNITNLTLNQDKFDSFDINSNSDFSNSAPIHEDIDVKQINLHHAKSATDLLGNALHMAQTVKSKLIILVQEPYIVNNEICGFDSQICNVFYSPKGEKPRTCIVATKNVSLTLLPQLCNGDTTSVILNTGKQGMNEELILSSAYFPFDH